MMFAALLLSPALTKMLNSVKDGPYIAGRESFGSRQVQAEALCIGKMSFEMAALEKNDAVLRLKLSNGRRVRSVRGSRRRETKSCNFMKLGVLHFTFFILAGGDPPLFCQGEDEFVRGREFARICRLD